MCVCVCVVSSVGVATITLLQIPLRSKNLHVHFFGVDGMKIWKYVQLLKLSVCVRTQYPHRPV